MKLRALVPGWLRDAHDLNDDTRDLEKVLSEHADTLRGLTVTLEKAVHDLKTDAEAR